MSDHVVPVVYNHKSKVEDLIAQNQRSGAGMSDPAFARWFAPGAGLVTALTAAITDLQTAQVAFKHGGMAGRAARDAKVVALRKARANCGTFVQGVADANPDDAHAIIAAAGFDERKKSSRTTLPVSLKAGPQPGSAIVKAKAAPRGKRAIYDVRTSVDGGHTWTPWPSNNYAKTPITGLPSSTVVCFQVRTTIAGVVGEWSQMVTFLVH